MLGDLKKFGLPNLKNLKVDQLLKGYGEQVCQLIDELVNLELYRRDFEFHRPIIPEDEEEQDELELSAQTNPDDAFNGASELVNGIEVQQHALMSPTGLAGKSRRRQTGLAEETKINFFDPNAVNNVEAAVLQPTENVQENILEA